jgi:EKC/KEOPS complex subunit CGI121/TPRKB
METYTLPYMPTELSQIHVRLFKNVSNAKDLRAGLIAAATMEGEAGDLERDKYDYCFVEAKTVRCS